MAKKKKVTETELEAVRKAVTSVNNITTQIGQLELSKQGLMQKYYQAEAELKKHQQELEDKYGSISVNLDDGTYTKVETEPQD